MSGGVCFNTFGAGVGALVKREDLAGIERANDIVARAHEQAAQILQDARAAFEAEKERGFAEGMAEAARESAGAATRALQAQDTALAALERDLGGVVHECVQKIIDSYENTALTTEIVRSALHAMRSEKRGQLFVPPDVVAEMREALTDLTQEFPEIELIDVIADPELQRPDLRLVTNLGVVSFVLNDTMADLRNLLENKG